jgi:hypothetical protein
MRDIKIKIIGGIGGDIAVAGAYLRLKSSTLGTLTVEVDGDRFSMDVGTAVNLAPFERLRVTAASAENGDAVFQVGRCGESVSYDAAVRRVISGGGSVAQNLFSHAAAELLQVSAVNGNRTWFIVQNQGTGNVMLSVDGSTWDGVQNRGMILGPGDYWEPPTGYIPHGEIWILGQGVAGQVYFAEAGIEPDSIGSL